MLVVYEDFEEWADNEALLALLDGQNSIPNTLYLATTNYFGDLPLRIINRPSRFATKIEVGPPSPVVRTEFFKRHIPEKYQREINLQEWVEKSEGLMIDHLKHIVQYVFVFDYSLEKAIEILRSFVIADKETAKEN